MRFMQHVRRFRRAPGQTLVLFALMSLVLIAGLGLVIDAGVDYAARRRMQNAADTAALAGTRVIARQVSAPVPKRAAVWSAIFDTAVANGAPNDATRFACDYIDNARNALNQPCSDNGSSPIPNGATGIRIRVTEQHTTFFMRAIGIKTSGTAATSTAQVQVVRELSMYDIPFMVCGIYSPNGAAESILEARDKPDPVQPKNGPQATPQAYITTLPDDGVARIKVVRLQLRLECAREQWRSDAEPFSAGLPHLLRYPAEKESVQPRSGGIQLARSDRAARQNHRQNAGVYDRSRQPIFPLPQSLVHDHVLRRLLPRRPTTRLYERAGIDRLP